MKPLRSLVEPIDVAFLAVLLLASFSGVYLTRLSVSPVYATTMLGILAACGYALAGSARAPLGTWSESLIIASLLLPIVIYQFGIQVGAGAVVNMAIGPLLAVMMPVIGRRLTRAQLVGIVRAFVLVTLMVATVESAWRLSHPDFERIEDATQNGADEDDILFYAYKFNSLMYLDSNFVGLQLVILFAMLFALRREDIRVPLYWKIWNFVLIVLTVSRASVITAVAVMFLVVLSRARGIVRMILVAAIAAAAIGMFLVIRNDPSFLSKFDILSRFVIYLRGADLTSLMMGVGVSRSLDVLGIGGHNFVVVYITELGLVVFVLWLLYWTWMLRFEPRLLIVLAAWFINGFSLSAVAAGYLFATGGLMRLLAQQRHVQPLPFDEAPNDAGAPHWVPS